MPITKTIRESNSRNWKWTCFPCGHDEELYKWHTMCSDVGAAFCVFTGTLTLSPSSASKTILERSRTIIAYNYSWSGCFDTPCCGLELDPEATGIKFRERLLGQSRQHPVSAGWWLSGFQLNDDKPKSQRFQSTQKIKEQATVGMPHAGEKHIIK